MKKIAQYCLGVLLFGVLMSACADPRKNYPRSGVAYLPNKELSKVTRAAVAGDRVAAYKLYLHHGMAMGDPVAGEAWHKRARELGIKD
ncbi:hypothetical protein [Roseimicrobium sp. ORNL1]|uniref:hypothetical protein n=1 Tax=Roseimicrobium sp. ORNL1 TaxID=2711231 RepID=UPI0013E199DD|nr:hypothetical protein [Roseimicrobium sp. ORNL1]QIF01743.1 hypothetical protein G5S37_09475 [Roseimicrobium sp. ORNL1]